MQENVITKKRHLGESILGAIEEDAQQAARRFGEVVIAGESQCEPRSCGSADHAEERLRVAVLGSGPRHFWGHNTNLRIKRPAG